MDRNTELTVRPDKNGRGGFYLHVASTDHRLIRAIWRCGLKDFKEGGDVVSDQIRNFANDHDIDLNAAD